MERERTRLVCGACPIWHIGLSHEITSGSAAHASRDRLDVGSNEVRQQQPRTAKVLHRAFRHFPSQPASQLYHGWQTFSKLLVRLEAVFLYLTIARHESHTYTEKKNIQSELTRFFSGSPASLLLYNICWKQLPISQRQLFRDFLLGQRSDCPTGALVFFHFALNTISQRELFQFFITIVFYSTDGREKFYRKIMMLRGF